MIKPILGGLAIALTFFIFAYFVIGLEYGTLDFWGAVGLLGLQSVIIDGIWGACFYFNVPKYVKREKGSRQWKL
jgi:hypothetical protein